jgi:DNA-binding NtrC family response regulator
VSLLIVDDEPQILDFFRGLVHRLHQPSLELTTMTDPREALRAIETTSYDLIISDFRMPHVAGVQILSASRRRHPSGRRVLMTGYNELPASIEELREAGIDAYLEKPLAAKDMLVLLWAFALGEDHSIEEYRRDARDLEARLASDAASKNAIP